MTLHLPEIDRASAADLLAEKPGTVLSAADVAKKAHRRWDLGQCENAAVLFCVAAERAAESPEDPNQYPNYAVRAGITLSLAGHPAAAERTLTEAAAFDWAGAGLEKDTNMIEWAYTRLLVAAAATHPARFGALFREAVARCAEVGISYPRIHPQQDELLPVAQQLGERDALERIIERTLARRPLPRAVKARVAEAQEVLAATR
ncbi:hypothetical protein [Mycetocola sp. JXN-3]|uniref:hypothetical protein n=1 Tax=Mycetocola sp. JXN-3 TaxID=2116510 RepID=UPI00165CF3D6|nr:hypothetical protein [Mycetocola sp. JXN-3]